MSTLETLKDVENETTFRNSSFFAREKVTWLWVNDFFDGPIDGIGEVNGELVFIKMAQEAQEHSEWFRRYWIIRLHEKQIETEKYWHKKFCEHVGTHFKCQPDGSRNVTGEMRPQQEWNSFYQPYNAQYKPDFSRNEVIGWFQW